MEAIADCNNGQALNATVNSDNQVTSPTAIEVKLGRDFPPLGITLLLPERRNSQKLMPWILNVSLMLIKIRWRSIPFKVEKPPMTRRRRAIRFIACSAILLFH